jgi:hypothetical protein
MLACMKLVMPIAAAIAIATTPTAVSAQLIEAGLPLGDERDPYAPAVDRFLQLVVQYTRWPDRPQRPIACVLTPADHADAVLESAKSANSTIIATVVSVDTLASTRCDIVYMGRISLREQREITDRMRGRAVVTVAENDPACRSRAMFCLLFEARSLSFRMNIDSISRSLIRVDPRVLRMGAGARL